MRVAAFSGQGIGLPGLRSRSIPGSRRLRAALCPGQHHRIRTESADRLSAGNDCPPSARLFVRNGGPGPKDRQPEKHPKAAIREEGANSTAVEDSTATEAA